MTDSPKTTWQDDPEKKAAAAAKRAATRAANKQAKQEQEAKKAERKRARAASAPIPVDDVPGEFGANIVAQARVRLAELDAERERVTALIEALA